MSLINTGDKDIYANMPVYWDVPNGNATDQKHSACGQIKGHPEGIIYPSTKMLDVDSELDELDAIRIAGGDRDDIKRVLQRRRRVIGWSLVSIFHFFCFPSSAYTNSYFLHFRITPSPVSSSI